MLDFSQELNQEQLAVVLMGDGPCLVLAGAGSGKTRVITYRVAHLLEKGVRPENILLVTFTNKAAEEMVNRVAKLAGRGRSFAPAQDDNMVSQGESQAPNKIYLPFAGTFHSIANKILRHYAPLIGYRANFSILDSEDSEALLKSCIKEFKKDEDKFPSAKVLGNILSFGRNAEETIDEVLTKKFSQWSHLETKIKDIAVRYAEKKKETNAMDFDDLLVNFLNLLNHPEVLAKFSDQFQYILVDEYQDTNKLQASIVDKLASKHRNVLAVGDDAQSIYSFRAADVENILRFEEKYPEAKIFRLETNYRSTQEILDLANNVIANNRHQYKKNLRTLKNSGVRPALHPEMDAEGEAEFVIRKITEALDGGVAPEQIAVLFRAAHHSQRLEMELMKRNIPYDYRGGVRFFERAHIKDILAYLRVLNNPTDAVAWLRILTKEEGIGPAAAQKLVDAIKNKGEALDSRFHGNDSMFEIGFQILGEKAKNGWKNFVSIWKKLLGVREQSPAEAIKAVLDSSYVNYLRNEFLDAEERAEDLKQLAVFAEQYENLDKFLAEATLQESFSRVRGANQKTSKEKKIILSTIHQAKGLEWHTVFLLNLSNGGFPNSRAMREGGGLEEERRLFYVAITRAKENLFLTYPMSSGGAGDFMSGPSIFLSEISSDLLDDHSMLSYNTSVLDDDEAGVHYVSEDRPLHLKSGEFLRSVEDL